MVFYAREYCDIVTDETLLIDYDYSRKLNDPSMDPRTEHGFKTHVNGMIIQVEGKRSKYFRSVFLSKAYKPDHPEQGSDFNLEAYIRQYVGNVTKCLTWLDEHSLIKDIQANLEAIIGFLSDHARDLKIFLGGEEDGGPVFQYKSRPNTLLYLFFGLQGVFTTERSLAFGLEAPLDEWYECSRLIPEATSPYNVAPSTLSERAYQINYLKYREAVEKAFGGAPAPAFLKLGDWGIPTDTEPRLLDLEVLDTRPTKHLKCVSEVSVTKPVPMMELSS